MNITNTPYYTCAQGAKISMAGYITAAGKPVKMIGLIKVGSVFKRSG